MKCNNCMANIPDDSVFCQKCGSRIVRKAENRAMNAQNSLRTMKTALDNLNYNRESDFIHNFNIAIDCAISAAEADSINTADQAMTDCVTAFDHVAAAMTNDIFRLSQYSMLPGGSPRAKALAASNKYIFVLNSLIRIFEIPNVSINTVNAAVKNVKKIANSRVLLQTSLQYMIKNDRSYDFDRELANAVKRNYPNANIK